MEKPELTIEEKSEVTGLSVEEYKEMAEAADKAKQEEEVKSKAEAGVIAEEPVLENQSSSEVRPPQAEESKAGAAEA